MRAAARQAVPARKGRRAGQPVHPREISFTAARRAAITAARDGTATASFPTAARCARRHAVLHELGRRRITTGRDRHRDHKTKAGQVFPAAGRSITTARHPPASPSAVPSPPEHQHPLSLHRRIVEPATAAERHPLHSHAQTESVTDRKPQRCRYGDGQKPQPGYLPGIGGSTLLTTGLRDDSRLSSCPRIKPLLDGPVPVSMVVRSASSVVVRCQFHVSSHRPEIDDCRDVRIFVHVEFEEALRRAAVREAELLGSAAAVVDRYRTRYIPGQLLYLAAARPWLSADLAIDNTIAAAPRIVDGAELTAAYERHLPRSRST